MVRRFIVEGRKTRKSFPRGLGNLLRPSASRMCARYRSATKVRPARLLALKKVTKSIDVLSGKVSQRQSGRYFQAFEYLSFQVGFRFDYFLPIFTSDRRALHQKHVQRL